MNKCVERIYNGIWKENPLFVLVLGTCPTLAVTTSAINGVGMGISTTAVLICSNAIIAAIRKIIPDKLRLPAEIVVVASLVTIVDLLMQGFVPDLYDALGVFIPLIVVNCIILGRAEAYAMKNDVVSSLFDGLGMGLGFTVALVLLGSFREILGSGQLFGFDIMPATYTPCSIFVLAPGAFFVFAALTAIQNKLKMPCATNGDGDPEDISCQGNCLTCGIRGNGAKKEELKASEEKAKANLSSPTKQSSVSTTLNEGKEAVK